MFRRRLDSSVKAILNAGSMPDFSLSRPSAWRIMVASIQRRVAVIGLFTLPPLALLTPAVRARLEAGWLRETLRFVNVLCVVGSVMAIDALCNKPKPGVRRMRRLWMFLLLTLICYSIELFVRFVFIPVWK